MTNAVDIIIFLHGNTDIVPSVFESLLAATEDLRTLRARIVLIKSSARKQSSSPAMSSYRRRLADICDVQILDSQSAPAAAWNKTLELARQSGRDAIFLEDDVQLTPGMLVEMATVANLDPMIGFVSPRSNGVGIGMSPYPDREHSFGLDAATQAHRAITNYLPRFTFVPTASGFCLYIKNLILVEFGLLEELDGFQGVEFEELMLRSNRRGYRVALANRAFAYRNEGATSGPQHLDPASAHATNHDVLRHRYPAYEVAARRQFESADRKAEELISGLVPDALGRYRLLFECAHLTTSHNGTAEVAREIIGAFVARHGQHYDCDILCSEAAYAFHGFDRISGLVHAEAPSLTGKAKSYAAAIRLAQPFALHDVIKIGSLAPLSGFLMLDTIALDCQNLDNGDGLWSLWHDMLQTTSIVAYVSEFSRDQFRRRFHIPPGVTEAVTLLSTDPAEYALPLSEASGHPAQKLPFDDYILVVGNEYAHKAIDETLAAFRRHEDKRPFVVLGCKLNDAEGMISFASGELSQEFVDKLYAGARVVLFPSFYEGFGLPIMHAIARRKPLVARSLPTANEIKQRTRGRDNIHLFDTTDDMVRHALSGISWIEKKARSSSQPAWTWQHTADALERAIREARKTFQFTNLRDRLQYISVCEKSLKGASAVQALDQKQTEIGDITEARDHWKTEAGRLAASRDEIRAELDRMRDASSHWKTEATALNASRAEVHGELVRALAANDHWKVELAAVNASRTEVQSELNRAIEGINHWKGEVEALVASRAEVETELGRAIDGISHWKGEVEALVASRKEVQLELDRAIEAINHWKAEVEALSASRKDVQAGLDRAMEGIDHWKAEAEALSASRTEVQSELHRAIEGINHWKSEAEALSASRAQVLDELAE